MEILALFVIVILLFYLLFPYILWIRIKDLTAKVESLESKLSYRPSLVPEPLPKKEEKIPPKETVSPSPKLVEPTKEELKTIPSPEPINTQPTGNKIDWSQIIKPEVPKKESNPIFAKFIEQLSDNWTGILGIFIFVVGVGFLGIYAALNMSAVMRFLMVFSIGLLLIGVSHYLLKREFWNQVGFWIRSGGGAVILFACVAGVSVPGMKWVESEIYALILISLGIFFNLIIAWFSSEQKFASLHIILSIITLCILPSSPMIFFLGVLVSTFSVFLSLRAKWEFHLIQTILSFLLLNIIYSDFFTAPNTELKSFVSKFWAIGGTVIVGLPAISIHYRRIYASLESKGLSILTHLTAWFSLFLGLSFYSSGSKWNPPILILVSITIYFMARQAKTRLKIRWLYITDTLISLTLIFVGFLLLKRWGFDFLLINLLTTTLFLTFIIVCSEEKEELLKRIGIILFHISLFTFLIQIISKYYYKYDLGTTSYISISFCMLILTFLLKIYDNIRFKNNKRTFDDIYSEINIFRVSPSGIFAGFIFSAICFQTKHLHHSEIILPLLGIGLLFIRQYKNWNGLGFGFIPIIICTHIITFYKVQNLEGFSVLFYDLPTLLFCFTLTLFSKFKTIENKFHYFSMIGASLISFHIITLTYFISEPYSPFLPGIIWLLLSVIYLEFHNILVKHSTVLKNDYLIPFTKALSVWRVFSILFVILFIVSHFLVHLQSEHLAFWQIKLRLLIQVFAIIVFLYWATTNKKTDIPIWKPLLAYFWELSVIFLSVVIVLEVPSQVLPIVWILFSFLLNQISSIKKLEISRFQFYSICLYWYSCIHVAFISSSNTTPSIHWLNQEWVSGIIAILLQTGYTILLKTKPNQLPIENKTYFQKVRNILVYLRTKSNLILFYPLFVTVALFLYWSFSSSVLTLLWMIEIFCIFLLALKLNEEQFRYVSLSAMVVCLVRLIFWDLSNSTTIARALVFLGVGIILILMNILYTKYKKRDLNNDSQ
ncbi:DUF2339 domain-containing protein [Leptospira sp. 96542]|nr:DUF2339 domain-containing protein [Leptospira sp. 96542]